MPFCTLVCEFGESVLSRKHSVAMLQPVPEIMAIRSQCVLVHDSANARVRPLSLTMTHELGLAKWLCSAAGFLAHVAAVRQAAGPLFGGGNLAFERSCAW